MKKIKILATISLLSFVLTLALPFGALAIGLVSEPIIRDNVLRGGEFQESLDIINTQNQEIVAIFGADGQIADWVKFYNTNNLENPIQEITIPALARGNVFAVFSIPQGTPNGVYRGLVSVAQKATDEKLAEGKSVSVSQKIDREVVINITDKEIIAFNASVIPVKYDLSKNEALKIRVIYDNQGNINLTPQIQIKIKNIETGAVAYNAIFPYPENEPSVKPSAIYEIPSIEIPTSGFVNGKYKTEVTILQGAQKALETSFVFSLGLFNVGSMLASIGGIFGSSFTINWFMIAGAALIIFVFFGMRIIKKKLSKATL